MDYKYKEIKEYAIETLKENIKYDKEYLNQDICDIHHDLFNQDYYLIGYYECRKWLKDEVFNVIECIKEYEEFNFGEVTTDFSNSEQVVNMYVYIIGEKLLYEDNIIDEIN
tara:strand:+ start:453 stop:785 length:333 start_codon:yes stop_codon:yes gene_type:complete